MEGIVSRSISVLSTSMTVSTLSQRVSLVAWNAPPKKDFYFWQRHCRSEKTEFLKIDLKYEKVEFELQKECQPSFDFGDNGIVRAIIVCLWDPSLSLSLFTNRVCTSAHYISSIHQLSPVCCM